MAKYGRDGSIDHRGIRNSIDFAINGGSRTIMLTYGDSLYSILTDQEVADVTKTVVEHTAGRAMVIAAEKQWWTGKAVEFTKYAKEAGAVIHAATEIFGIAQRWRHKPYYSLNDQKMEKWGDCFRKLSLLSKAPARQ